VAVALQQDSRLDGGHVDNILSCYRGASKVEKMNGENWYAVARAACLEIHPNGIGIVAALSPSTAWDMNLYAAQELVTTGYTRYQSRSNNVKAQRILAGESALDVLGGNKVRAFYNAIAGDEGPAVIDRHALSVYLGRHSTDKNTAVLQRKGAYQLVADAYHKAAEILGIDRHTVQAVTWVTWRNANGKA
jgi:hypothetical protein